MIEVATTVASLDVRLLRHRPFGLVEQLGFDEHHRVVVGDGRQQQALGFVRGCWGDNFQTGHVHQPRL